MDWPKITEELTRKLDPNNVVKAKPGGFGPKGDYLEGWHVINEANRIFGFDGWSYTIDLRQDDVRQATGDKAQWQAAYTCICTLTVGGVTRQDVGFGSGYAAKIGDAIEGATKEAVTDALKRALRTFGNPFGLALYDKSRENVGVDLPPYDPNAALSRLLAGLAKRKTKQAMREYCLAEKESLGELKDNAVDLYAKWIDALKLAGEKAIDDPARQAPEDEAA